MPDAVSDRVYKGNIGSTAAAILLIAVELELERGSRYLLLAGCDI